MNLKQLNKKIGPKYAVDTYRMSEGTCREEITLWERQGTAKKPNWWSTETISFNWRKPHQRQAAYAAMLAAVKSQEEK